MARRRCTFVGTAAHIADEMNRYVQASACDGFILVPNLTPHGLDEFVDRVVPLLQERGMYRTEYTGPDAAGSSRASVSALDHAHQA